MKLGAPGAGPPHSLARRSGRVVTRADLAAVGAHLEAELAEDLAASRRSRSAAGCTCRCRSRWRPSWSRRGKTESQATRRTGRGGLHLQVGQPRSSSTLPLGQKMARTGPQVGGGRCPRRLAAGATVCPPVPPHRRRPLPPSPRLPAARRPDRPPLPPVARRCHPRRPGPSPPPGRPRPAGASAPPPRHAERRSRPYGSRQLQALATTQGEQEEKSESHGPPRRPYGAPRRDRKRRAGRRRRASGLCRDQHARAPSEI